MQPVLERGRDPEVPASPTEAPEQLRLALGVDAQAFAGGGDELDTDEVVDGEAALAHQVAEPAAQRQPADAGVADHAARGGQPGGLRGAVELTPEDAACRPRGARRGIDGDRLHQRQVDHHAVVADGVARDGVTAAPDRDAEVALAREADGLGNVVGAGAARDQRGPAVDRAVPDAARLVVALFAGLQQGTAEAGAEFIDHGRGRSRLQRSRAFLREHRGEPRTQVIGPRPPQR